MENTTIKINCWELKNGKEIPQLPTSTLDGFEWNAKYRLTVSDDDGSLGLPFLFATDDTAILTVTRTEQEGKKVSNKTIEQVISCVPRSLGNEITCSRIRSYNGKEHVWSAWETISSASGTKVTWDASSCVDTFITAGIYNISGERLNVKDGLPIANSNPGHTIHARLLVLDSSIAGTGDEQDKCITQVLTLSNRTGGDGDVYIRTGHAHSTNMLIGGAGWEPWSKLQQNIEVGQVTSLNGFTGNGMYSGVYTDGSTFFETFVMVVINNYAVAGANGKVRSVSQFKYALALDGTFSYKTRIGHGNTGIEWGSWVDLGAATTTDIQDGAITAQKLSSDLREKVDKVPLLEETATKEKTALVNGDTIVGLAREVYSRQGKTDTSTFLRRTTAGGTSVSDGVATLKRIGGNIVNNLENDSINWGNPVKLSLQSEIFKASISGDAGLGSCVITFGTLNLHPSHKYYVSIKLFSDYAVTVFFASGYGGTSIILNSKQSGWRNVSKVVYADEIKKDAITIFPWGYNGVAIVGATAYFSRPIVIDLTEMFGAGNEPTNEECDTMFGTMDALPQGLIVAQPTGFKSTGFNQWNPVNLLVDKSITDYAIFDGDNNIAVIECLPCKIGVGENNGYIIGYGEGDTWSDEGVEVYLTPLNPIEVDGELYLQKLDKDATYGTYVPQIKGYLLVVTPTIDKLCAHLHWSGDREITDYEEYVESNVALPAIPEMSEWGLAGKYIEGEFVQDVIDLENSKYIKRIGVDGEGNFVPLESPEEYPIVTKTAPNYIGSDYGVECFVGSKTPLTANILFYMRSIVSETRNFLDRLMAGLRLNDTTAVADRIVAAVVADDSV